MYIVQITYADNTQKIQKATAHRTMRLIRMVENTNWSIKVYHDNNMPVTISKMVTIRNTL